MGTFLAMKTKPQSLTMTDTRVTGLWKATGFGTQLPSLQSYHADKLWLVRVLRTATQTSHNQTGSVFRKAVFF